MVDIDHIISGYRDEADVDFVGLWQIASTIQSKSGSPDQVQIRRYVLKVARGLMALGVYPGDYTLEDLQQGRGFQFWPGTPDELLNRIEAEWILLGKTPNLEHSICWFALRPGAK